VVWDTCSSQRYLASLGESTRKRSRAAPHIKDRGSVELLDQFGVHVQVRPVVIHDVVQRRKSRIRKDGIGHTPIMADLKLSVPAVADGAGRQVSLGETQTLISKRAGQSLRGGGRAGAWAGDLLASNGEE
jgi:hypothetical protein